MYRTCTWKRGTWPRRERGCEMAMACCLARNAFSRLSPSRAVARLCTAVPRDRIFLQGLVFHGYHGDLPEVSA